MTNFLSLSAKSTQDKLLNLDTISVIQEMSVHAGGPTKTDVVCFYSEKSGEVAQYQKQDLYEDYVSKINEYLGLEKPFLKLDIFTPSINADPQMTLYIDPRAIQSVIFSEKASDNTLSVAINIAGYGEVKSSHVTMAMMEYIVASIDKPMFYIDGDLITTDLDTTSFMLHDTTRISHIYSDTGHALNIVFNDASSTRIMGVGHDQPSDASLKAICEIAYHIASDSDDLEEIETEDQVFFSRMKDVKRISRDRERLCFEYFKAARRSFNQKLYVGYRTPEKAKRVINRLLGLKAD